MRRDLMRTSLLALLGGMLWMACGAPPERVGAPSEEPLGSSEAALCSGLSVNSLTLQGVSSYQGELAGGGNWTVSTGANAVKLEYFLNGASYAAEERVGNSGSWFFSQSGVACGVHAFEVKAWPMVIDSAGNRTVCTSTSTVLFQNVPQTCARATTGLYHTVELKADGTVWTWGHNTYGQVGSGTLTPDSAPVRVRGLANIIAVSAGYYHSVALREDGTVWTWGYNTYGQLGDGTTTNRLLPVQVPGL
ncbi:RCC1 domain-containing protein, partial [Archangium violaceum]|uniref:RCC1 domain-containing protein n=1 Tax=Archangium violaceum TaxID=83451 RepID=UPI0034E19F72